jgi:hypothetical protein
MTSVQQPLPSEPPLPQRGLTRGDRGRDVNEAQYQNKNNPEQYAANKAKYAKKKW